MSNCLPAPPKCAPAVEPGVYQAPQGDALPCDSYAMRYYCAAQQGSGCLKPLGDADATIEAQRDQRSNWDYGPLISKTYNDCPNQTDQYNGART